MSTMIVSPNPQQSIRNTIFDDTRVLNDMNKGKPFILNRRNELTMLASPASLIPRNFVDNNGECTIRYSEETSYPYDILVLNNSAIRLFPRFTPIAPDPEIQYRFADYDKTEVFVHSHVPRVHEEEPQPEKPAKPVIPKASDYFNYLLPTTEQYQGLDLTQPLPQQEIVETPEPPSICQRVPRNQIRFSFTNDVNEFYAPAASGRPTATLPITDVLRNYYSYLHQEDGAETNAMAAAVDFPTAPAPLPAGPSSFADADGGAAGAPFGAAAPSPFGAAAPSPFGAAAPSPAPFSEPSPSSFYQGTPSPFSLASTAPAPSPMSVDQLVAEAQKIPDTPRFGGFETISEE